MKIFISGKITGEPIAECFEKFRQASDSWTRTRAAIIKKKVVAMNPLMLPGICFDIEHGEAMNICFDALAKCDAIFMLKDWKQSKGAQMEHEKAKSLGLEIHYEKQTQ